MDYRLRLNIKAISLAERLLGKPYSDFNHESEEDSAVLLYAMTLANNDEVFTLGGFKKLLANEKTYADMMREAERAILFIAQFGKAPLNPPAGGTFEDPHPLPPHTCGAVSEPLYVSDVANVLILHGVSARYVMYEMDLYEMEGLMKQLDAMKKERLEEGRLWSFYGVLPHTNKIKKPSDLILFEWERDDEKRLAEIAIERDLERFEMFFNNTNYGCKKTICS